MPDDVGKELQTAIDRFEVHKALPGRLSCAIYLLWVATAQLVSVQAATDQLRLAQDVLQARRELRERNLLPARPTEAQLKGLDASVKKNTALIRRLRTVSDGGAGLLEDIQRTNQSKASGLCLAMEPQYLVRTLFFLRQSVLRFCDECSNVESCSTSARQLLHLRRPTSRSRTSALPFRYMQYLGHYLIALSNASKFMSVTKLSKYFCTQLSQ